MNDHALSPMSGTPDQLGKLRQLTLIVYILYALSTFTGVSAVVAIIINLVKREDVRGTLYDSHFKWQMRTFWWGLLWAVLGGATVWIGLGFVVLAANWVWLVYRIVRGLLNWNDVKPMPA
jgi:uncharacterized membrane protein